MISIACLMLLFTQHNVNKHKRTHEQKATWMSAKTCTQQHMHEQVH